MKCGDLDCLRQIRRCHTAGFDGLCGKDQIARFCQSRPEKVPCITAIRQERDDARKALGWCLEGFEAEKCEGFYESPLYKKIERLLGDALIRKIQAAEAREED